MSARIECLLKGIGSIKEVSEALRNLPQDEQPTANRVKSMEMYIAQMMQEPETRRACLALCCAVVNEHGKNTDRFVWVDAGNEIRVTYPEQPEFHNIMRSLYCIG